MNKRTIDSCNLFQADQEVIILHAGEQYRIRITSNNKLIMTK
ncbi:MAG: hemin uptake protein HemP [Geobacter sp.]|jgi:hemin uptake protein HemP|nr:hemin uptake protein HemP [Trichlorobacter sp.]MDY0384987.1 hemin uptake protein HemP [Trichlorobacter sp.]